jgi:hypothetical protein
MFTFQFIKGLSVGLEYVEAEEIGFVVNVDLGIFRVTWYRDLIED